MRHYLVVDLSLPVLCAVSRSGLYVGHAWSRSLFDFHLVPVYPGMRITLTRNLNKKIGFVNGMGATVLAMGQAGLLVRTDQERTIMVHPWTDENRVTAFPFRLGYASTLHRVQGATLEHITLWLDLPNMPAAAYVALSRVQVDACSAVRPQTLRPHPRKTHFHHIF